MIFVLTTFLFLNPVVLLVLFLIFSPVQLMRTNVLSIRIVGGELMGFNDMGYEGERGVKDVSWVISLLNHFR